MGSQKNSLDGTKTDFALTLKMATHQLILSVGLEWDSGLNLIGWFLDDLGRGHLFRLPLLSQSPFPSFRMLFKEKVSRSICLWNNYFKHGYNTDFSSNTEEIYLAKFLSPTKNYTNISLNTTVKRTSRKNLMFGTQKEGKKKNKPNPNRKTPERQGKGEEGKGRRANTAHITVSRYTGSPARGKGSAHIE